ncbi:MAG: hypothetical protein AAFR61_04475 [Bacteroidota bacterium]
MMLFQLMGMVEGTTQPKKMEEKKATVPPKKKTVSKPVTQEEIPHAARHD